MKCLSCPYAVHRPAPNYFPWIPGGKMFRVVCSLKKTPETCEQKEAGA